MPTAKPPLGVDCDKHGIANFFDVSIGTVEHWRRKGCPVRRSGVKRSELIYNSAEVFKWLRIRHAEDHGPVAVALLNKDFLIEKLELDIEQSKAGA
jgi:phage terminase Nu1 subunit (DNA packaging protein)